MPVVVALAEAKKRLADLVDDAAKGAEIVMMRDGKPVARLIAVDEIDQEAPVRGRRVRSLQAGLNDPTSAQVQWGMRPGAPHRPAA